MSCGGSDPALLWLRHGPAAAADWTPSLGTSICPGSGPRRKGKKTKKKKKKKRLMLQNLEYHILKKKVEILYAV